MLVLRHSPDLARSLGELSRVVVDGGRLLIVDVGPHSMDAFRRRIGDSSMGLDRGKVASALNSVAFNVSCERELPLPEAGSPAPPTRPAPALFLITAERRPRSLEQIQ
jgi:ubiquinone/menaquinone biosynthesis C-methylase UbiE